MEGQSMVNIRKAIRDDVPYIVSLLADDLLAAQRECCQTPLSQQYYSAFQAIDADQNNYLAVAELDGKIVGTLQLTFITHLTYQGGRRAQIEAVRVNKAYRGKSIGRTMIEWAIAKARQNNCHAIQLTTNKKRLDALKFYEKLGFAATHEGMKLHL